MAIQLTEEWQSAIDGALVDGCPIVWSSVDPEGQPYLAFFGTTQALDEQRIALWMRTPERGFLQRIEKNPKVALLYRNPQTRLAFQIHGEARREDDPGLCDQIYENSAEVERERDPDRIGVAVVVDVVRVIQRGEVVQVRD